MFFTHWSNSNRTEWKFYWNLTKLQNINAPQGRIPCTIFTKFAEFVSRFRMRYLLKFGWICSRGYGVMEGFKLRGRVSPNIQRPLAAKLCVGPPKVLEVQECAQGPLLPCQVWWGSDFSHPGVLLCICMSITLLNVRVCTPDFAMKALGYRHDFDTIV